MPLVRGRFGLGMEAFLRYPLGLGFLVALHVSLCSTPQLHADVLKRAGTSPGARVKAGTEGHTWSVKLDVGIWYLGAGLGSCS